MNSQFEEEYLNAFCNEISDETQLNQSSFLQLYDHGITHFTNYVKNEVLKNLSKIEKGKETYYLKYIKNKIENTPYYNTDENIINQWLIKFNEKIENFPFPENIEIRQYLKINHKASHLSHDQSMQVWNIQIKFYVYACMKEAKKIINYINSFENTNNSTEEKTSNKPNKPNKLTSNQIVILLDKIGLLTNVFFETLPNTKKAYVLSLITGLNEKNLKTAIERLEKTPKELNDNYRKDIKLVEEIFENLQ